MEHALYHKALALQEQGDLMAARAAYSLYLADATTADQDGKDPQYLAALVNMGSVCLQSDEHEAAASYLLKAAALAPTDSTILYLQGNAYREAEAYKKACAAYARSARHARTVADKGRALFAMGQIWLKLRFWHRAVRAFDRAHTAQPHILEYGAHLADALSKVGRLSESLDVLEALYQEHPEKSELVTNLANLYYSMGRSADNLRLLRHAITLNPDNCAARSNVLMGLQYSPEASDARLLDEARQWGQWAMARAAQRQRFHLGPWHLAGQRPLRVGYVSGDFCSHPVGWLFRDILAQHDAAAVTPFLFSNGSTRDALFYSLVAAAQSKGGDAFEVKTLDDKAMAQLARQKRMDIWVDLSGHTGLTRLPAFAWQGAPLQISWLGYFATTGLPLMDYVIMDPHHAPDGAERLFTEGLLRLPHNRFCYSPAPFMPESPTPSPFVRKGHVTFASFNNTAKYTATVLEAWAAILQNVVNSRLILKYRNFSDPVYCASVHDFFAQRSIEKARVELRPASPHQAMLYEYLDVDIALDPFPFSGGHTSSEALWMGLPVVTFPQERVVSRQTYSFLMNMGLPGLAAHSLEDYVRLAVRLAHSPDLLQELRGSLRQRMRDCPLCDVQGFTRHLEEAYALAWQAKMDFLRNAQGFAYT